MDRSILPIREEKLQIEPALDIRDQNPPFAPAVRVRPPAGAPNILVVLIDDMGFGASSAFGGPCRMPTAERLAGDGLSYNRFHTTALCSPTRAALLTGRNHHTCGMGAIPELATSAPGYTTRRPDEVATIARILQLNGYATGAFGKMHQTPTADTSPVGPFDRWPTADGFEKFYGFIGGEANQFTPSLFDGLNPIDPPYTEEEGYHLSKDLVDQSISWIRSVGTLDPDKPWFSYLSFGACHAPFHVPQDWRDRYRGEFDHGWDEQRTRTLVKQKEMGIVPDDAQLAPWIDGVDHWNALTDTQKVVGARLMETYAAFAEHTDAQVGRLVDALEQTGELDNTLVFYILGDNGASTEGGLEGTLNEYITLNALEPDTSDRILTQLDEIGGPMTYPHYPVGWALAMDTPYAWAKQVASHYGGTRNGMITHWPRGVRANGELRHQWHHVIDIVPTILEAANLPVPQEVDGVKQHPIEGTSFFYTFNDPDAEDRHTSQYFEIFGNRGIYDHGWTAVTKHRTPWETGAVALPRFQEDVWELYDTNTDWTQANDVAADYPEKLAELQGKFLEAAERYGVLPLDDRLAERFHPVLAGRYDLFGNRKSIVLYPGLPGLHEDTAPNVKNTSFAITVQITVPNSGAEGVVMAQGGRFGGWSLYIREGKLSYCHNLCGVERHYVRSDHIIVSGEHEVQFRFQYDGGGAGMGGQGKLFIDGNSVGSGYISRTTPYFFSANETMNLGRDRGTPVTEEYPQGISNSFSGTIHFARIDLIGNESDLPLDEILRAALVIH